MRGVVRDVPRDVKSGLTFKSLVVSLRDNTIWCSPPPPKIIATMEVLDFLWLIQPNWEK